MKNKRLFYFLFAVFILIESAAVFYALIPVWLKKDKGGSAEIRLGIVPEISKSDSREAWVNFFKFFEKWEGIEIVPYYASSPEEAVAGFISGSLDMIYINPALFLELRKKYAAQPVVAHKLSPEELENNRAVLVSANKNIKYLEESKGASAVFSNELSMTDFIVPEKYIFDKTGSDLKSWFSAVSFSESPDSSISFLDASKADFAAFNLSFLISAEKNGALKKEVSILWMSMILPENIICVSPASELYGSGSLDKFKRILWEMSAERRKHMNKESMSFEPVNFDYLTRLDNLEKYLARKPGGTSPASKQKQEK